MLAAKYLGGVAPIRPGGTKNGTRGINRNGSRSPNRAP